MIRLSVLMILVAGLVMPGCRTHQCAIRGGRVSMTLRAVDAESVQFVSSLDNHRLHRATRTRSGDWMITVPASREFRYYYLIDGAVFIPDCALKEQDDFGSENCIYIPLP